MRACLRGGLEPLRRKAVAPGLGGPLHSLNGRVTVDGVTYEDFGESTGCYGEGGHGALGDRLQGVNRRHHFGPWLPGMPRSFHPNPRHPSGKSDEETYKLTQKQRTLERALRDTRRELSAALENYKRYPNEKTQLAVNQPRAQLKRQNDKMKALLAKNKGILTGQPARESVGNLPRVDVPAASGRNIDECLHDDGVQIL